MKWKIFLSFPWPDYFSLRTKHFELIFWSAILQVGHGIPSAGPVDPSMSAGQVLQMILCHKSYTEISSDTSSRKPSRLSVSHIINDDLFNLSWQEEA